jgi:hypothetical protein
MHCIDEGEESGEQEWQENIHRGNREIASEDDGT